MNKEKKYFFDDIIKNKNAMEKGILKHFTKNKLLQQFANVYLGSFSAQSMQYMNKEKLISFIEKRFDIFIKTAESKQKKFLNISHLTSSKSTNYYSLEIIQKDIQHLIFTIENIFHKNDIVISKMYHPLVSLYVNNAGKVILIDKPKQETLMLSSSYLEFEFNGSESELDILKNEIHDKLSDVNYSNQDKVTILKNLFYVQKEVIKHPTPRIEFQKEWIELFDWLANGNFTFLSYCELKIKKDKKISYVTKSGLGILNDKNTSPSKKELIADIKKESERLKDYRSPFVFDRISFISPVKIFEPVMRLSLKIPTTDNEIIEYNITGIFTKSSLLSRNLNTPIIKLKINKIIEEKHFWEGSHNYIQALRYLNKMPKFELFRTPTENIQEIIEHLMSITNFDRIYLFTRKRIDQSKLFMMLVLPPKRFNFDNINIALDYLLSQVPNNGHEHIVIDGEIFCRIHLYIDVKDKTEWYPDIKELEQGVAPLIDSWDNQFKLALNQHFSVEESTRLYLKYSNAIPFHHKIRRTVDYIIDDIYYFEKLSETNHIQFNVKPFVFHDSVLSNKVLLLIVYNKEKIDLIHFMPIFQNLELHIYDEITARVGSIDNQIGYIHTYRIAHKDESKLNLEETKPLLIDLMNAIYDNKIPNDPINGLVVKAGLSWKEVLILQAYRNYLVQLTSNYSKEFINNTLLKYYDSVKLMLKYFQEKFIYHDSHLASKNRLSVMAKTEKHFFNSLNNVKAINEDFILKWIFNLIQHTLRTNFSCDSFQKDQLLALKFDCENMQIPDPRPYREIFVFSPDMEGIHIRFGSVARGGIRWSNREDFRNEVIGLSHTQKVKNVVIVPTGSKGGFIIKKSFKREDAAKESQLQYESFMTGLLTLTDNLSISGSAKKPHRVLCYDNDDPYLVVAADKGTAMFSDYANAISEQKEFWLGDAFASGGSVGYNHKEYGITAKGAWECVKLHFKERNFDIQSQEFSVVGVGDMSGDVFGNGMLLSKTIKLIAAFNHLHIFIDPNPDPKKSWEERKRLFELPRSSWTDYSTNLISSGGGIYNRSDKKITISNIAKNMLNLETNELNGEELIHAVLKLKTDLLWFGGIGTYIKSSSQSHLSVRDPGNNGVRIDVEDCNSAVIGEGANLGITQEARIKLEEKGIHLNTDFIDNSAGVNMSDYEVNIKILLQLLLRKKIIKTVSERNKILASCGEEVVQKVLVNNNEQHMLLSMEAFRSVTYFSVYRKLMNHFIHEKVIDPVIDAVPDESTLNVLQAEKKGLPRALLALLQSHVKIQIYNELINYGYMDNQFFDQIFMPYFPKKLIAKFEKDIHKHPLKKEIICMLVTNYVVNRAGILFFSSVQNVVPMSIGKITIAFIIVDYCFRLLIVRQNIANSKLTLNEQYNLLIDIEDIVKTIVIDLISLPNFDVSFDLAPTFFDILDIETDILGLKQPHLANLDEILPIMTAHQNVTDIFYVFKTNKNIDLKTSIILSNYVNEYFSFTLLKNIIRDLTPTTSWEVEQQMMTLKVLQHKIFLIYDQIIAKLTKKDKVTKESLKLIVEKTFSNNLDDYIQTLNTLLANKDFSLTSLSVIVNKLNIID